MEESEGHSFDDFSIEMEDFEYTLVNKFERIFNLGEGGSYAQEPHLYKGLVYVGCLDRNLYALDAKNGELVWKFTADSGFAISSPVIYDGVIYIGSYDYNFYAVDAETGEMIWKFRTQDKVTCSCSVSKGKVYFGSKDHNVYCLDAKTGQLIWKYTTYAEIASKPTVYEGKVFIGSYDRFMYCLDADTGNVIWKLETQGYIFNMDSFIVHEDKLYFGSFDNLLRVVDVNTGKLLWKFLTGHYGGMNAGPAICKNVLYQTNREGTLFALTMDGKVLWKFSINLPISGPIVHEDRIYIGAGDYNLHCLDMNGKQLWSFHTQGEVWYKSTIHDNKIYFTSWDCFLYCVDIDTQRLLWKFRGQGSPSYLPPPYDSYELSVKKPVEETSYKEDTGRKTYDIEGLEEESTSEYKSRITYQVSTQYSAKGKYQKDSKEEEF